MADKGGLVKAVERLAPSSPSTPPRETTHNALRQRYRGSITFEQTNHSSSTGSLAGADPRSSPLRSATNDFQAATRASKQSHTASYPGHPKEGNDLGQFLGDSWNQSWSSVQAFASNILSATGSRPSSMVWSDRRRSRDPSQPNTWGPTPPSRRPVTQDAATGSLTQREAALKAAKTARILESHEGVNGGLDIKGHHKRRSSDEIEDGTPQPDAHLVYVHEVQPHDTYAGIILRYRCREDVFRRSNGLWSRDSVQMRKWLIIPVDACEIKGRPCQPPSWHKEAQTDLLAPTPPIVEAIPSVGQASNDDFFQRSQDPTGRCQADCSEQPQEYDAPWTHVRWVHIDSFRDPVQIARVARQSLGYFPPRRKKSLGTSSSMSTPRQSSELSSLPPSSVERTFSRQPSSLGASTSMLPAPVSSQDQTGARLTGDLTYSRPGWMRRPGGVGSMSQSVATPGPDKDYLNAWTKKHLPGLNIDTLPSMAIMGSETAQFGFGHAYTDIVENTLERGTESQARSQQVNGLDKAAAAVEHWLRGALSRRPSGFPGDRAKNFGLSSDQGITDLIELTDAPVEDHLISHNAADTAAIGRSSSMISHNPTTSKKRNGETLTHRANSEPDNERACKKSD